MSAEREALAEVIARHQRLLLSGGACLCDEWPPVDNRDVTWMDHLADAVLAHQEADRTQAEPLVSVLRLIGRAPVVVGIYTTLAGAEAAAVRDAGCGIQWTHHGMALTGRLDGHETDAYLLEPHDVLAHQQERSATNATEHQARGVMHYVEGWLSGNYPEAAAYLRDRIDEIAEQMVDDECADPDEDTAAIPDVGTLDSFEGAHCPCKHTALDHTWIGCEKCPCSRSGIHAALASTAWARYVDVRIAGTAVTEWGVGIDDGAVTSVPKIVWQFAAGSIAPRFTRTRLRRPDVVSEWTPVEDGGL